MPKERSWHWVSFGHITNSVARLSADQRGGVAIMMGLLFPVLLAGLGFGFEISNWYLKTRAMQNAADAAATAAASNGEDNYNLEAAAVAANYGFIDGTDNVSVTASNDATCPAGDGINPPCYSVTISSKVPLFLSQLVGYTGDTSLNGVPEKLLTSAAVAIQTTRQQPICLLTLSQSGQGIRTDGATELEFRRLQRDVGFRINVQWFRLECYLRAGGRHQFRLRQQAKIQYSGRSRSLRRVSHQHSGQYMRRGHKRLSARTAKKE